ncbi:endospore germination permease [Clostridium lundense]|uniref:endospore germination permease n=1 Tax=Clostridium lundense TaxID=319475 RepID=UPI000486E645|nr:endospore germination permease [Clostridium lundense]
MNKITSKQFIFLIMALTIVSLKTYPSIFLNNGGRDTWIATIIASVIIVFYFIFALKVFKKTDCYNLYHIYISSFGKIFGNILYAFFMISLFLTLIECAGVESSSMHTNLLLETPIWYLLLFLIFPAIYCVKKGLRSLVCLAIVGMILMNLAGINLAILTSTYKHFEFLLPILEKGITFNFLLSILKILGLYSHITITFSYMEKVSKKDTLFRDSLLTFLFVIQMEIVGVLGILTTFQVERAEELVYPKLLQTQLISYLRFIESGEFFVMLQTIGGWYIKYILVLNLVINNLKKIYFENKYTVYIISILTFIATSYIADNLFYFFKFLNFYSYISLINFLIIPFIAIIIFSFKNKKHMKSK